MTMETVVTKGTSPIPPKIRKQAGIGPTTAVTWKLQDDGSIVVCKTSDPLNKAQRHIRERSGTWNGKISGAELLRKTRP